jgi:hypothetical protein
MGSFKFEVWNPGTCPECNENLAIADLKNEKEFLDENGK